jgi:hypothetical protein
VGDTVTIEFNMETNEVCLLSKISTYVFARQAYCLRAYAHASMFAHSKQYLMLPAISINPTFHPSFARRASRA